MGTGLEYLGVLFDFTLRAIFGIFIFGCVNYVMSLPQPVLW